MTKDSWMLGSFVFGLLILCEPMGVFSEEQSPDELVTSVKALGASVRMAIDNSKHLCPQACRTVAGEFKEGSTQSKSLLQVADRLGGIPEKEQADPMATPDGDAKTYTFFYCPRWLLTWSDHLQGDGRNEDCRAVAEASGVLSAIAKEWALTESDDKVYNEKRAAYAHAMAQMAEAQIKYCVSGAAVDGVVVEQRRQEAIKANEAIRAHVNTRKH